MERITVEVSWDAPDGTLDDLENEGGDGTLVVAALDALGIAAANANVNATRESR